MKSFKEFKKLSRQEKGYYVEQLRPSYDFEGDYVEEDSLKLEIVYAFDEETYKEAIDNLEQFYNSYK